MENKSKGKAVERIDALLDERSFVEIGQAVTARSTDFQLDKVETPSDGVVTGYGRSMDVQSMYTVRMRLCLVVPLEKCMPEKSQICMIWQ